MISVPPLTVVVVWCWCLLEVRLGLLVQLLLLLATLFDATVYCLLLLLATLLVATVYCLR